MAQRLIEFEFSAAKPKRKGSGVMFAIFNVFE